MKKDMYIPGKYKVTNKENILTFFDNIEFTITDLELDAINEGYEMNEDGFMFYNGEWVKTAIYDSIWKFNSKLVKAYFVPYYVTGTRLFPDHPESGVRGKVVKLHQVHVYNNADAVNNPSEYRTLCKRKKTVDVFLKERKPRNEINKSKH